MGKPDQPFGWRKRIGLLSPTVIETTAYDFYKVKLCTEPAGDLDDKSFVRRMFSDASCGASEIR